MLKLILKKLFIFLYQVEVKGLENYHEAGKRVLIVANHLSFLDGLLLALFLPEKPLFAVNTFFTQQWWAKPLLALAEVYPIDQTNAMATKSLINEIRKDKKCVIFPEGRITVTGSLMKIYEGPGIIAEKSDAMILPIRLDGAQYSPFSRLKGRVKIHLFPKITLTFLKPVKFEMTENASGRQRRTTNADKLYDIMTEMLFSSSDYKKTLFLSLLDAKKIHGRNHEIAIDIKRTPITYQQFITRSFILGEHVAKSTEHGQYVGLMLPNMISSVVTLFSMFAYGRVPAMINYSTGGQNFIAACRVAQLKIIYTSKKFVEEAGLLGLIELAKKENVEIHYLEDIAQQVSLWQKLKGMIRAQFPQTYLKKINFSKPDDPAIILFTSGSEGTPKGVVLSHSNIQANRFQLASRIDFNGKDMVFNVLPIFHSFGLTGGTLLPILSGIKTFFYPSPLHYRIVPELIYDSGATILFGTNTFLANYARFAHSYDFYSLRYVFAGAEKLDEETRRIWSEKFGVRIFEGYGTTETSPAVSTNTPMHNKPGTVGRFMPGIQFELEDIPGIQDGRKLLVRGPNIMKGYLLSDNPGKIVPPHNGWYDTGDIVSVDYAGYISIKGRAKRFAKIGGEMVSLSASEIAISQFYPNYQHAVIALPDPKKGEQLILISTHPNLTRTDIVTHFKSHNLSELSVPRDIIQVNALPLLGTGKTDYVKIKEMAIHLKETQTTNTPIEQAEIDLS
jgi:acyl-[acyl-carrier-protein]-phospholipid O-acyltransferase/long-chain-fatty-acid--[acyl-carrier-protein] ligase